MFNCTEWKNCGGIKVAYGRIHREKHFLNEISSGLVNFGLKYVCVCAQLCLAFFRQAPLSRGFSRQEYWSGLPFPPPGDLQG